MADEDQEKCSECTEEEECVGHWIDRWESELLGGDDENQN